MNINNTSSCGNSKKFTIYSDVVLKLVVLMVLLQIKLKRYHTNED